MGGRRGSLGPGWTHYLMAPGWPQLTSQLCQLQLVLAVLNLTMCLPCTYLSFIPRFGPPVSGSLVRRAFITATTRDSLTNRFWFLSPTVELLPIFLFGGQKLGIPNYLPQKRVKRARRLRDWTNPNWTNHHKRSFLSWTSFQSVGMFNFQGDCYIFHVGIPIWVINNLDYTHLVQMMLVQIGG